MSIELSGIGMSGSSGMQHGREGSALSQDQRQLIEETLARYDSQNLTSADASAIVEAFSALGVQPGRPLAETMQAFGFDARSVGELAGVGPARGEGPPPSGGKVQTLDISDEMLQELNALLNSYYDEGQSEDQRASTLDAIKSIFSQTMPEGGLVNVRA